MFSRESYITSVSEKAIQDRISREEFKTYLMAIFSTITEVFLFLNGDENNVFSITAKDICDELGQNIPKGYDHLLHPPVEYKDIFDLSHSIAGQKLSYAFSKFGQE